MVVPIRLLQRAVIGKPPAYRRASPESLDTQTTFVPAGNVHPAVYPYGEAATPPVATARLAQDKLRSRDLNLARHYGPILRFHRDETRLAGDPNEVLERAALKYRLSGGRDTTLVSPGRLTVELLIRQKVRGDSSGYSPTGVKTPFYLELSEVDYPGEKATAANEITAPCYAIVRSVPGHPDYLYIHYGFFYPHDSQLGGIVSHQGDWEILTLCMTTPTQDQPLGELKGICIARHGDLQAWKACSKMPSIRVERGSHAMDTLSAEEALRDRGPCWNTGQWVKLANDESVLRFSGAWGNDNTKPGRSPEGLPYKPWYVAPQKFLGIPP